jgi:Tol biopolymer transport system component/DNA-binding winged helix-turn-helix (wHTH) protein
MPRLLNRRMSTGRTAEGAPFDASTGDGYTFAQVRGMLFPPRPISALRFGIFEVNLAAHEVRKHGVRVRLSGHAYEILAMLLESPGQVLTREQLRARLWPAETFVDFEHGLNTAVKKLRAALGDSPQCPRYIETIPRAGYRFIAPVQLDAGRERVAVESQPALPATPRLETAQVPRRAIPRAMWIGILGLGIMILTLAVIRVSSRPKIRLVRSTQLTNAARVDRWGRIQTDGVRLFFLERQGHRWDLMQMPASGGEKQPFAPSLLNMRVLAVSPDASQMIVAAFTSRSDSLELSLMPAVGGRPLRIGTITATDAVFTPDGKQITYSTGDGIYMAGLAGTDLRRLVALEGIKRALDWSPDGRVLRFELEEPKAQTTAIWETDIGGHPAHPILPGWDDEPSELSGRWTPNGRYYIFVSHRHGGAQNIWALPEERYAWFAKFRGPVQLSTGPITMDQPLLSRDGRRLFVLGSNERSEYVRYDLRAREYRGLLSGAAALCTSFSSDGQWVAYCSDDALWLSRADGSERRELVSRWFHPGIPRISPNGKELVFEGHPQGKNTPRIYLVSLDGGAPRELVVEQFPTTAPNWSPDGLSLLYCVPTDAGTPAGLYVFDRRTRAKTKLPESAGIWKSAWSPDGKYLAVGSEDSRTIRVSDMASKHWTEVTTGKVLGPAVWSQDSRYIYFQDVLDEGEPVRRMNLQTRRVESVFDCSALLEAGVQRCGFEDLTPDGSLVLRLTRGDHDIYVLELELP